MADPTQRFSNRVENYVKYRPDYPKAIIQTLQEECGLTPATVIADIGSGTGILTKMFLKNGNTVFAVEPNREMRLAAERILQNYPSLHSVDATAESTTLTDSSVDLITAGQAFHWFDEEKARLEFMRILNPGGWVVLIWNERELDTSPFLIAYEKLLRRFATDYTEVDHRNVDEAALKTFYGTKGFEIKSFPHHQSFDLESVQGRLLSSSYAPEAGHPNHEPMLAELEKLFHAHKANGKINFEYRTKIYFGRLS